ncbi:hypothetical protein SEA_UTZCHIPS_58 [Microbacterium phage UtzChips]|nr:hypothetical protein SEA_UTZCHIPS_58 [Microbacterium phage UtzChips]
MATNVETIEIAARDIKVGDVLVYRYFAGKESHFRRLEVKGLRYTAKRVVLNPETSAWARGLETRVTVERASAPILSREEQIALVRERYFSGDEA